MKRVVSGLRSGHWPLIIFALGVATVLGAMAWVTRQTLALERREQEARARAERQETIRLALWRMDSALAPLIAPEASRPYFEYQSFYPSERAYTQMWEAVRPGELLVPSPLLTFQSDFIKLHFQQAEDGRFSSPQAPEGNMRDTAEAYYVDTLHVQEAEVLLADVQRLLVPVAPIVSLDQLEGRSNSGLPPGSTDLSALAIQPPPGAASGQVQQWSDAQLSKSINEYSLREELAQQTRNAPASQIAQIETKYKAADAEADKQVPALSTETAKQIVALTDAAAPAKPASPGVTPTIIEHGRTPAATGAPADRSDPTEGAKAEKAKDVGRKSEVADELHAASEPRPAAEFDESRSARALDPSSPAPPAARPGAPDLNTRADPAPSWSGVNGDVNTGPLEPAWKTGSDGNPELLFTRSIHVEDHEFRQGFWVDWEPLRATLLARISDLLPQSSILPVDHDPNPAPEALLLAGIPARLDPGTPPAVARTLFTPTRAALGLSWAALLAAVAAIAMVLRASMVLSERRARFVSAVTHELRTPLTTFCLYSQMLADGMVANEAARREYVGTLKHESSRLARIVENVLDYARLGRAPRARVGAHEIDAADLLLRVQKPLLARAEQDQRPLVVQAQNLEGVRIDAEPATVERILLNLVDNSCKYGDGPDKTILLSAYSHARELRFEVTDRGPGISTSDRNRVFGPFQRSSRAEDAVKRGLGLGLALAKGLARELGGDLRLIPVSTPGTTVRLTIPAAASASQA